jgi:hypothetical protein
VLGEIKGLCRTVPLSGFQRFELLLECHEPQFPIHRHIVERFELFQSFSKFACLLLHRTFQTLPVLLHDFFGAFLLSDVTDQPQKTWTFTGMALAQAASYGYGYRVMASERELHLPHYREVR